LKVQVTNRVHRIKKEGREGWQKRPQEDSEDPVVGYGKTRSRKKKQHSGDKRGPKRNQDTRWEKKTSFGQTNSAPRTEEKKRWGEVWEDGVIRTRGPLKGWETSEIRTDITSTTLSKEGGGGIQKRKR